MINNDNTQEKKLKLANPEEKQLEREKRKKRKSKEEDQEESNQENDVIFNTDIKRRILIEEIKNKIDLKNDVDSSLRTFIANGQVDHDNFSLKKFINQIDNIENDLEIQESDIQNTSKETENEFSTRRFKTKMKFSERFKDDNQEY